MHDMPLVSLYTRETIKNFSVSPILKNPNPEYLQIERNLEENFIVKGANLKKDNENKK